MLSVQVQTALLVELPNLRIGEFLEAYDAYRRYVTGSHARKEAAFKQDWVTSAKVGT